MAENVGIGMPLKSPGMGDLHAAQNQGAAVFKGMYVIANANSCHAVM